MRLFALVPLFSFIALVLLGMFVLLRNSSQIRNRLFFALCLATGFWGIAFYGTVTASDAESARFFYIMHLFMAFSGSSFLHFIHSVCQKSAVHSHQWKRGWIYVPAFALCAFAMVTGPTSQLPTPALDGWGYSTTTTPLYLWLLYGWSVFVMLASINILFRFYKSDSDEVRKKDAYFLARVLVLSAILEILVDIGLRLVGMQGPRSGQILSTFIICYVFWVYWRGDIVNQSFAAERIIAIMRDCLIIVGSDNRIERVNDAVTRLLGYENNELIGQPIKNLFAEGTNPDRISLLDKTSRNSMPETFAEIETVFRKKSGESINVSLSQSMIRNDNERCVGMVLLARDLSERNLVDEELRRSQKLASLSKLSAGIAHDFNNVLTAVLGNITLLGKKINQSEEIASILAATERAALAAKSLAGQLLTFSSGGDPIKETVYPEAFLNDAVDFTLKGSNVEYTIAMEADLFAVEVDISQITQAISSIVMNARQSMSQGGKLTVQCRNRLNGETGLPFLDHEKYVEFNFADHGHGIKKELISRVFDPFFTTRQEGSGLGLSVSYSIVKKHGGHIDVQSREGVGTIIRLFLPASDNIPIVNVKEEAFVPTNKGPVRILVMDDDEIVRTTFQMILAELGCESDFAVHGTQAIEYFQKAFSSGNPYDLCFMDLTIPGNIGGKEAIGKLLEINPSVKAIVTSGYSDDPVMARFRDYGFSGVLPKPFQFDEVETLVTRFSVSSH